LLLLLLLLLTGADRRSCNSTDGTANQSALPPISFAARKGADSGSGCRTGGSSFLCWGASHKSEAESGKESKGQ
jgi:hypothetical protein